MADDNETPATGPAPRRRRKRQGADPPAVEVVLLPGDEAPATRPRGGGAMTPGPELVEV